MPATLKSEPTPIAPAWRFPTCFACGRPIKLHRIGEHVACGTLGLADRGGTKAGDEDEALARQNTPHIVP